MRGVGGEGGAHTPEPRAPHTLRHGSLFFPGFFECVTDLGSPLSAPRSPPFSLRHLPLTLLLQNRAVTVLISRRAAPPASLIAAPAARSP